MPYLRMTRTPVVRKTPLGAYMCFTHPLVLEAFTSIIEIDESSEMLFQLCDGTRTREDILHQLSKESGEPVEAFADDFDAFVQYMVGEGVLEWRDEPSYIEPLYDKTRPLSLTLALTFDCNLKCSFCAVEGGTAQPDEMTLDDIAPVLEQTKRLKPSPFYLSGGEPLLRKEMVLHILEEICPVDGISVSIFTNGTLITKDYAQQLHDAGLQMIRVSVDAHTEELGDRIRGKGAFKKTVQGIKHLKDVGIHVDAVSLISQTNYCYLKEIKEFVKQIADSYVINRIIPMGRAVDSDLFLNEEELIKVRMANFETEQIQAAITPRNGCIVGLPLYIRADGEIFPCFYMQLPEFSLGNIRENTLSDVYNTALMQELFQLTVDNIEECKDCDIRYFCGGGCRATPYRLKGSLRVPDPFDCSVYKAMARKILEQGEETTRKSLQDLITATKALGKSH